MAQRSIHEGQNSPREGGLAQSFMSESEALVDREAFLVVLRALSTSEVRDAPLRAERWMLRLEKLHAISCAGSNPSEKDSTERLRPDQECYERVISTWLRADKEDPRISIARSEKWLQPNTKILNLFLDLCTKGRGAKSGLNLAVKHAEKAESILKDMIEDSERLGFRSTIAPNKDSFNFVIRGWTRCRKIPNIVERTSNALQLFEEYQKTHDASVAPDQKSYAMLLDALSVRAKMKVAKCRDWGNKELNGFSELETIERIIRHMHDIGEESNPDLSPTAHSYNILLSCWANLAPGHTNAPFEAEKVLHRMSRFKNEGEDSISPDTVSYTIVMRAWANSTHPTAPERVVWWLTKLLRDYDMTRDERLRPNTKLYNVVLRTLCAAQEMTKAEKILSSLIQHSQNDSNNDLAPNSESFVCVIRGWAGLAKKGSIDALKRAARQLDILIDYEMAETGLLSSLDLFERILDACAHLAPVKPVVLDTAVDTFEKLRRSRHTTSCQAFASLLHTGLLALSRPENDHVRQAFVTELIKDCCEAGLVGRPVLRALSNGPVRHTGYTFEASERLIADLFPYWPLPASW
eukprot:CAMPEP_0168718216 /NCGR_PEP_ID=MMETSP0724-20121128/400_1 /TAXON_ID=265536 /ORGANISM="Amphiprora sp., Strain CCMP467" /LENGTH=578 /DNA_ID=CAMNT_0008764715 /DNA_START=193 /DNA_END=1927 /DNA_ORIENTATION=+